jgi:hypothetical protein
MADSKPLLTIFDKIDMWRGKKRYNPNTGMADDVDSMDKSLIRNVEGPSSGGTGGGSGSGGAAPGS